MNAQNKSGPNKWTRKSKENKMEKQLAFSVYDAKAEAYMQPWFLPTEALAVRAFQDCANDPEHNFGKHPEDYTLFMVGAWSPETGTLTCPDTPFAVLTGISAIHPKKKDN